MKPSTFNGIIQNVIIRLSLKAILFKLNLKIKEMNESEYMTLTIEGFQLILLERYDFLQCKAINSKSLFIKSYLN